MIVEYWNGYADDAECADDDYEPQHQITTKCTDCGKLENELVADSELRRFVLNQDGTYTTPYEQCAVCIDKE